MSVVEKIKSESQSLSDQERAELAHFFLTSLGPNDPRSQAEWEAELAKRVEDIRSGKADGRDLDEAMADFEKRFP